MDQNHQPAVIAVCPYCRQPLYEHAPISTAPGAPSHVACVIHGRLDHSVYYEDASPSLP